MPIESLIPQSLVDATRNPEETLGFLQSGALSTNQRLFLVRETNSNRDLVMSIVDILDRFLEDRELLLETAQVILETEAENVPLNWFYLAQTDFGKATEIYLGACDLIKSLVPLSEKGINPWDFIGTEEQRNP